MKEWIRKDGTRDQRHVRQVITYGLTPEFANALTSFCNAYGFKNIAGVPQWPEGMRFLVTSAILAQSPPQVRAAKAVHIAIKMLVMTIGPSLARAVDTEGYRRNEQIGARPRTPSLTARISLDAWMRRQLNHPDILKHYRDGKGRVLDARMVTELALVAMADPRLDETARMYRRWMDPMRNAIWQLDGHVRGAMRDLISALASTDTRLPDALAMGEDARVGGAA